MRSLNVKLRENAYEAYLNATFVAKLNLITSSSIHESLRKKWRVALSDREMRVVIKFLNAEGVTGSEIHRELSDVYGAPNPQPKMLFRQSTLCNRRGSSERSCQVLR